MHLSLVDPLVMKNIEREKKLEGETKDEFVMKELRNLQGKRDKSMLKSSYVGEEYLNSLRREYPLLYIEHESLTSSDEDSPNKFRY